MVGGRNTIHLQYRKMPRECEEITLEQNPISRSRPKIVWVQTKIILGRNKFNKWGLLGINPTWV